MLFAIVALPVLTGPAQNTRSFHKEPDGIEIPLRQGNLRLRIYNPHTIRVTYARVAGASDKSFAVITQPQSTPYTARVIGNQAILRTSELEARVDLTKETVAFFDRAGHPITSEKSGRRIGGEWKSGQPTRWTRQPFTLAPGEAIFGLGQHADQPINYRGSVVHLQQRNTDVAVPMLVSSRGYGILWDNPSITDVNVGSGEETIPAANLLDEDGHPGGLTGRYYTGQNFDNLVATRRDPKIDFLWSAKPPQGLPHDHYSVRWTGWLQAKGEGDYTLLASADDGVRLWVDDKLVAQDWRSRPIATVPARLHFKAGSRHHIRMEFYQDGGQSIVKLAWRPPVADPTLTWSSESANAVDYFFMYGPELDSVIASYRHLTGPAPLLPKWAYGLFQCKERYKTQQELLDVAAEYRRRHIPIDGIIQDWQYWSPHPWGSHLFDANRYPDPAAMMRQLHAENYHLLISVWPKFANGAETGDELAKAGAMYTKVMPSVYPVGQERWYDPFNPTGAKIYWRQVSDLIFSKGVDGWWLDASEPELGGRWGEYRDFDTAAGPGAKVFNAYPLLHTTAVYKGQRQETDKKRVVILTRSAYAGQQRNSAITWSGDINGTWDVFASQIPAGINFSLSGIPYWNTDTGGFFSGNPDTADYRELFTRWFQFSAFCPMLRIHGTNYPKEMWRFGPETEKRLIETDRLRYRLMPYIYSDAWSVTHDGSTMMRGLAMDFRNDPAVYDIGDQYMFGPSLMVCPVTTPRATTRQVYLPKGRNWYDFWTGQAIPGGRTITAPAPIDRLPLYVPAGSILPYGPAVENTTQSDDPLELRIYTGADASFTLYEDEGDGYGYEHGRYATIKITWNDRRHELIIEPRQGSFPGMRSQRTFRAVLVTPGTGAATATKYRELTYHGGRLQMKL